MVNALYVTCPKNFHAAEAIPQEAYFVGGRIQALFSNSSSLPHKASGELRNEMQARQYLGSLTEQQSLSGLQFVSCILVVPRFFMSIWSNVEDITYANRGLEAVHRLRGQIQILTDINGLDALEISERQGILQNGGTRANRAEAFFKHVKSQALVGLVLKITFIAAATLFMQAPSPVLVKYSLTFAVALLATLAARKSIWNPDKNLTGMALGFFQCPQIFKMKVGGYDEPDQITSCEIIPR